MKRAAFGIRMHSGWGVLVTITGDTDSLEVLDRRRIAITDPKTAGANQPYHYAANLEFPDAEEHIRGCAALSERMALAAIAEVVRMLSQYRIVGSGVLLASSRPLPSLEKILGAHPLIHTAEGEFFRNAVSKACEDFKIPVMGIKERKLEEQTKKAFGSAASRVQRRISNLGSSIGPPWTKDHKNAALAAAVILHAR